MIGQVRRFMGQWNMVRPGDTVAAAVSGGADSVCLLLVLAELAGELDFTLTAVHVEHGIRGAESERDAEFVRRLCADRGIELTLRHVDVPRYAREHGLGTEEAARILRYEVFAGLADTMAGGRLTLALAHQMEDNAETLLMALARGTGPDGLCGIPPVRRDGELCFIRPLLNVGREQIENFLAARRQDYCMDSTNLETAYTRNYIRREVLPLLARVNPQAVVHMNRTAAQMTSLREYMERETDEAYARVAAAGSAGMLRLDAGGLAELPRTLRERVVHRAVGEAAGAKKDISAAHIEAVLGLLERQSGRRVELPCGVTAVREYGNICLCAGGAGTDGRKAGNEVLFVAPEQLRTLRGESGTLTLSLGENRGFLELRVFHYGGKSDEISTKNYTKWFDYDIIKNGFSVRGRRSGDFFVIDADGHRKKLSDYLVDEKIPANRRDELLLLAAGSEVLWLIGGRMGRSGMVTERTETVLEITCNRGEEYGLYKET